MRTNFYQIFQISQRIRVNWGNVWQVILIYIIEYNKYIGKRKKLEPLHLEIPEGEDGRDVFIDWASLKKVREMMSSYKASPPRDQITKTAEILVHETQQSPRPLRKFENIENIDGLLQERPESYMSNISKADKKKLKDQNISEYLAIKRDKLKDILNGTNPQSRITTPSEFTPKTPFGDEINRLISEDINADRKWEFVICFSNPDSESGGLVINRGNAKGISEKYALEIFRTCFKQEETPATYLTGKLAKMEERVFLECFRDLADLPGGGEKLLTRGGRFKEIVNESAINETYWEDTGNYIYIYIYNPF